MQRARALLVVLLLSPAAAAAEPPPAHVDLAVGIGGGLLYLDGPDDAEGGSVIGLLAGVAYLTSRGVGPVAELSMWHGAPGQCMADGSCYNQVAEHARLLTAGVRWYLSPRQYLQGSGGVTAITDGGWAPDRWAPTGVVGAGWTWELDDLVVGFELRAAAFHRDGVTVGTGVALLSGAHRW